MRKVFFTAALCVLGQCCASIVLELLEQQKAKLDNQNPKGTN